MYQGDQLMVVENYLDKSECDYWIKFADESMGVKALVGSAKPSGVVKNESNEAFVADRINLFSEPDVKKNAIKLYSDIYGNIVPAHYGTDIEWFEIPHILRYKQGGNYHFHADAEAWDQDSNSWVRGIDRDYSCLTYLNSEYTGGALTFPYLNLRLHPCEGLLVAFPSDHRFLHSAEQTLSGVRYVMTTWGAAKGTMRVMPRPPALIVRL